MSLSQVLACCLLTPMCRLRSCRSLSLHRLPLTWTARGQHHPHLGHSEAVSMWSPQNRSSGTLPTGVLHLSGAQDSMHALS